MAQQTVTNIFNRSRDKATVPVPDAVWRDPRYFIAFGFGSGAIPFAPGTFGTLLAIPFYLVLQPLPLWAYLSVVLAVILASAWLSDVISKEIQAHDHPGMNLDEFAGFFVTMINAPLGWPWVLLGFILFRVFDIWKPWPIDWIDEKIHGGLGMILDDVAAGIMAMIIIQLLRFIT